MNRKLYLHTFIYISSFYAIIISAIILVDFTFQLTSSMLPAILGMAISYVVTLVLFSFAYRVYSPMYHQSLKESNLNKNLLELMQKSIHAKNSDELYQLILESAIKSIPNAQKGCILLLNPSTNMLQFTAAIGYDLDILKTTFLRLDQTYLYRESKGKITHTIVIDDPFGYDRANLHDKNIDTILQAGDYEVLSTLSTPVILGDTLYGMINIDSKFRNIYTKEDQHIIELFALEVINVIKLYESIEKVNFLANHDALTNTYNRKYFNEVIVQQYLITEKAGSHLSLISLDVKRLKSINAELGYDCGDKVLIEFVYGIKKHLKPNEEIARYGCDEFMILLPNTSYDEANELVATISLYFTNHPLIFKGTTVPLNFSYGIASYPEDHHTYKGLIALADQRMYKSK